MDAGRWRPFVGRSDELERLEDLLTDHRLVTVVGVGGAGKSRLVRELLERSDDWWDAPIVVDAVQTERTPLLQLVAFEAGIAETPGDARVEQVAQAIDGPGRIVVFDACEVAARDVLDLATSLLGSTSDLHIVCTSRAPLGTSAEHVMRLQGLEPGDAVQLFRSVAARVAPETPLGPNDERAIEDVCARLDGLPLAIELAAGRLTVLRPSQLLALLDEGLDMLVDRSRGDRQQALADVIGLSISSLDDDARGVLEQLAVMTGRFSLADAATAAGRTVVAELEALVGRGLVEVVPAGGQLRYRVLDTIRSAAAAQTDPATVAGVRERLVSRVAAQVTEASAGGAPEDDEQATAALEWALDAGDERSGVIAVALTPHWLRRGHLSEGRRLLRRAASLAGDGRRPSILRAEARLALAQSDVEAARALLLEAGRSLDATADALGRDQLQLDFAELLAHEGRNQQAIALLSETASRTAGVDDATSLAATIRLADLHQITGEPARALELAQQAVAEARAHGDRRAEAEAHMVAGRSHELRSELEPARFAFESSLSIHEVLRDDAGIARALGALSRLATAAGRFDDAAELQARAVEHVRATRYDRAIVTALSDLAWTLFLLNRLEGSHRLYHEAARAAQRTGHRRDIATALLGATNTAFLLNHPLEELRREVERAIGMFDALDDGRNRAHATYLAAEIALEQADHDASAVHAARACELFERYELPPHVALPLITGAGVAIELGRHDEAADHLRRAVAAASDMVNPAAVRRALASVAALVAERAPGTATELMGWAVRMGTAGFTQRRFRSMAARVESAGRQACDDFDVRWSRPVPTVEALVVAMQHALDDAARSPVTSTAWINVLGRFDVRGVNGALPVAAGTSATLLKLVALRRSVHADEVAFALWPDADEPTARDRLRSALARVRRAVGDVVARDGDLLVLRPTVEVDLHALEDAVRRALEARQRGDDAAVAFAREAVARYGGDLLPGDPYADWAVAERDRARRRHRAALEILVDDAVDHGETADAVDFLERISALDPFDESVYLRMAELLQARGWRTRAAAVLRRAQRAMAEIGVEPSAALVASSRAIAEQRRPLAG